MRSALLCSDYMLLTICGEQCVLAISEEIWAHLTCLLPRKGCASFLQGISMLMLGLAKLDASPGEELLRLAADSLRENLQGCNHQAVANTFYSLARLQFYDEQLCAAVEQHVSRNMSQFRPQVWSLIDNLPCHASSPEVRSNAYISSVLQPLSCGRTRCMLDSLQSLPSRAIYIRPGFAFHLQWRIHTACFCAGIDEHSVGLRTI